MQKSHRLGNPGEPPEGLGPPNLARDGNYGVSTAVLRPFGRQKPNFSQQFPVVEPKERAYAGILQCRQRKSAAGENRIHPARNACAEGAVRIKEEPTFGVAAFSIGVFVG
jgi:hypothetical protein